MTSRVVVVDRPGLALSPVSDEYVEALKLPAGTVIDDEEDRLMWLAPLRESAGVTVYTGPLGAPFWSLVSYEVNVRVIPDDYDYGERTTDPLLWGLRAAGLPERDAGRMAKGYSDAKPPTAKHGLRGAWEEADGLRTRLEALGNTGAKAGTIGPSVSPIVTEEFPSQAITDPAEQLRFLDALPKRKLFSFDYEWDIDTLDTHGLGVSDDNDNYYLPVIASDFSISGPHHKHLRKAVKRAMRRGVETIWHNGKSDMLTQWPGDPLRAPPFHDTLVLASAAGEKVLGLKPLGRSRLGRDPMEYPLGHKGGLSTLPLALGTRYAAAGDTRNTYDLYHNLLADVKARGQWGHYMEFERPLPPILASMERYGQLVDPEELQRLSVTLGETAQEHADAAYADGGYDITDKSNSDEQTRLYIKHKTGFFPGSLAKDALALETGEWMDPVIMFRRIRHRKTAFADKHVERWERAGKPVEFYAFSHFNQAGEQLIDGRGFRAAPRTGRLSSSGDFGNMQNQPRDIRSAFIAPPGCLLWSLDYSGLELHIAACMSADPEMLRVLAEVCPDPGPEGCEHRPKHGDMHDSFLYKIIAMTSVDVGRPTAKAGNFEQLYGGRAGQLVHILAIERAHITMKIAQLVVDAHHEAYSAYHDYAAQIVADAQLNGGYSETLFGNRRYEQDIFSGDPERRQWAERALVNMTIQGTAADILKRAMIWALPVLRSFGAHMSLQVHDELVGWVPEEVAPAFLSAMRGVLESIEIPGLALRADGGAGKNWAEVH